jgi:hypothetical protein
MIAVARSVRSLVASVSLIVTAFSAVAQTTWIVNQANPPGTNFTSIQAAVAAASPGDAIIVVGPGTYSGATVKKGVYLLGQGSPYLNSGAGYNASLTIDAIPNGQHVVVKGMSVRGIACTNSSGTIHFEEVTASGPNLPYESPIALSIDQCAHVSALDSAFAGSTIQYVPIFLVPYGAGPGIQVRNSGLHLTRCTATGAAFVHPYNPISYVAPAVSATASRLVIVDTSLRGGAWQKCYPAFPFCNGSVAEALNASNGCTLVTKGTSFPNGSSGAGIIGDIATLVVYDPNTVIVASGPQLVPQAIDDLQTAGVPPGSIFSATLNAGTTQPVPFAVWAALPGRPILHPLSIWLDLAAPVQLFAGTVNGSRTDSAQIPSLFPLGFPVALQAVLLVNGQLELSTPVALILY